MQKEEWVLTNEHVTDFEFRAEKIFNMLVDNQMFEQLKTIVGAKNVKYLISDIFSRAIPVLSKVDSEEKQWKMFQHLLPQEDDPDAKKSKKEDYLMKNGKKRKHYHHFVQLTMFRSNYFALLKLHHRLNTFSMAMIIRIIVLVFLDLYNKNGKNKEKTLEAMVKVIEKIINNKVKAEINFILLRENLKDSNKWRAVAFFQIEIFYGKNKKASYFFRKRL